VNALIAGSTRLQRSPGRARLHEVAALAGCLAHRAIGQGQRNAFSVVYLISACERSCSPERLMKISSNPPLARIVVRGSGLVLKSALNSVVAVLIIAIALVGTLA
jgi:hypothetical protein